MLDAHLFEGPVMSIHAIAQSVGVSKSTVSRVLNDVPGVRPEVASAVREQMKHMGYQPPARRRGPKPASRSGIRTGNLLLLMFGYTSAELYRMPLFPLLLHGVESSVRQAGLNLILASSDPEGVIPAALSASQVDGVLLFGRARQLTAAVLARLATLPVVVLMRSRMQLGQPTDGVVYNNAAVGSLAARYLLKRHHSCLAYLNPLPLHDAFTQRQRDFVAAVRQAEAHVVELISDSQNDGPPSADDVRELVRRWLALSPRPTGLFVPSDAILPQLYSELQLSGVMPGRDLDIVSCDNEPQFLKGLDPRPATIDINLELVAKRGVEQLLWRIAHPEEESRITVLVEPRLIEPA